MPRQVDVEDARRQSSGVMSMIFTGWVMPALLIRMSTWPNASSTRSAAALQACQVGDVAGEAAMWPSPSSAAARLRAGLVEIEDGDPGAVLGEEPRGREADPARAGGARDDGGLAGKQHAFLPIFREAVELLGRGDKQFTDNSGAIHACSSGCRSRRLRCRRRDLRYSSGAPPRSRAGRFRLLSVQRLKIQLSSSSVRAIAQTAPWVANTAVGAGTRASGRCR